MDKIYIPTLGRHSNQVTWNNLPKFLQLITEFVIQPKEQQFFLDKPHLVLPENDIGISNTRKWIWEQGHDKIYGIFDDDLEFVKRVPNQKPTKIPMTDYDWKIAISEIDNWLNGYFGFAGFLRGNLPPRDKETNENAESLQAVFYNGKKLPKVNQLEWEPNLYAEDVKLHLQLLLKGFPNIVWNTYGMVSKQFTEGGCQSDISISSKGRTTEDTDKSHEHMVDNYYPYVQYKTKHGQLVINPDGIRKLTIYYKKAYASSI